MNVPIINASAPTATRPYRIEDRILEFLLLSGKVVSVIEKLKRASWSPSTYAGVKSYGKLRFLDENTGTTSAEKLSLSASPVNRNPKVFAINGVC
jgi:hypothetical protein